MLVKESLELSREPALGVCPMQTERLDRQCDGQYRGYPRCPPPRKVTRRTRKSVAFMNMDNCPRWGAKNVQFFVMSCRRRTIAGLVFLLIGHSR